MWLLAGFRLKSTALDCDHCEVPAPAVYTTCFTMVLTSCSRHHSLPCTHSSIEMNKMQTLRSLFQSLLMIVFTAVLSVISRSNKVSLHPWCLQCTESSYFQTGS